MVHDINTLQQFEQEIADIYATGDILHPVHLRASEDGAYEKNMIKAFSKIRPKDYFFGYWDSHIACLLKGVPPEELKDAIVRGDSIALCFPKHRILCSGIVGSLMGVAVGTAWAIKRAGLDERVYLYCGDMSAETGIFHESIKYADINNLPLTYIVGNNGVSVLTHTASSWGYKFDTNWSDNIDQQWGNIREIRFDYKNKWPHSGLNFKVKF